MVSQRIAEIEEYQEAGFLIKKLYNGAQSDVLVICLKPGQEVPSHPHDRLELVLLPQKGQALLMLEGEEPVGLDPGTVYCEPAGRRFGIVNDGESNFQMVVVLIRTVDKSFD